MCAWKLKSTPTDRLLALRAAAGGDVEKNAYYHALVGRYQRWVLWVFRRRAEQIS